MIRLLHARIGRRLARVVGSDERGVALALVLVLGSVLLLMSATVVTVSISGSTKSTTDANWNAAASAAYAGIEDYQSKIANDASYSLYGAPDTPFSATSTFPMKTGGNPAFGLGTTGTWASVEASSSGSNSTTSNVGETYRYQVDNSQYSTKGILRLQSTGRAGNTTRTVVADLKQSGFIDFLYFTNYEISDPAVSDADCTPAYQWAVASRPNCTTIQFAPKDVINGPVDSNDTMNICGSTFKAAVTSASTVTNRYILPSGCTAPTFANGATGPGLSPVIQMPQTNLTMLQETRADLPATVANPGCLFTGPTTITFNSDGTMTVFSPFTKATETTGTAAPMAFANTKCGAVALQGATPTAGTVLNRAGGQKFTVPDNNLIYVQDVPSVTTDPNYWPTTGADSLPTGFTCTGANGTSIGNGVGYPAVGEVAPSTSSYGCRKGDAFVQGTLSGHVTVASSNYLYITGNLLLNDASTDMLGLVGQNNVYVYNPASVLPFNFTCDKNGNAQTGGRYTCTNSGTLLNESATGLTVNAAILSVAHSFIVENYNVDAGHPKGLLNITGAIAQNFRGTVATTTDGQTITTGYTKNYAYDPRMAFQAPPKFLNPVSTTYGVSQVVETKTAISPTGATIP